MITDEQAHIIKHTMKSCYTRMETQGVKKKFLKPWEFFFFFFERKMKRKKINFIMLKLVLTTHNNFTHVFILTQSDLHVFSLGARQMS